MLKQNQLFIQSKCRVSYCRQNCFVLRQWKKSYFCKLKKLLSYVTGIPLSSQSISATHERQHFRSVSFFYFFYAISILNTLNVICLINSLPFFFFLPSLNIQGRRLLQMRTRMKNLNPEVIKIIPSINFQIQFLLLPFSLFLLLYSLNGSSFMKSECKESPTNQDLFKYIQRFFLYICQTNKPS